ncbi:MAG: hypothetical protein UR30_C0005G0021 [Candidatus Peregrinibacteria bacterium GW2011_GWC2_33_13]|nr:MAG: hypothetical protein UR30_C0005G0021 [Candidatus Peregrinibacteria bacterium GW2011_GWC2_33_13]
MKKFKERYESMNDLVYVTHSCIKCEGAFQDIDFYDSVNFPPSYKYCPRCVDKGFNNPKRFLRLKIPENIREKEHSGINIDYFILLINEKLACVPEFKQYATKILKASVAYLDREKLKGKKISKLHYQSCLDMAIEKTSYSISRPSKSLLEAS